MIGGYWNLGNASYVLLDIFFLKALKDK